jgi:hypothetical protein
MIDSMVDFDEWLRKSGLSEAQVGKKLGVSQVSVHRYRTHERIPKPDVMDKIGRLSGGQVAGADWYRAWQKRRRKKD